MKKITNRILIALLGIVIIFIAATTALFWNELRSLASIKKIDDYGMFHMTYFGDYGFDDFLETGAENDADIEAFVIKRLLKGIPIDISITGGGCTAFATKSDNGNIIFGRNFDFQYSPSMQVITKPRNGYASVSTVNLSFAGYSENSLPSNYFDSFLTLAAPFLPFDGMNEKGVAIAILAVPEADPPFDKAKVTLNTTATVRLVLDKAATVLEAAELLKQYNIYFSGGIDCHFLIADASGDSILAEYYGGDLKITANDEPYQIASNFIAFNDINIGEGFDEFERYNTVKKTIDNNGGYLSEQEAIGLLSKVGIISDGNDKLQWSVLYNLSMLEGTIFANRNTENLIDFQLKQ